MISKIKKPVSILLSLIMVFSMFAIVPFTAGATEKTIAEGVIYKLGDTIVLPGDGIYYVKDSERHPAQEVYSNGTITEFEGDEYSYSLMIDEWGIYARLDTFDYEAEINQGMSVLGITFTGSGTESDPYLPKLALGVFESTWAGEGEGTEDSPWLINDVKDLRTLSANVKSGMKYTGKYLKLMADIDCGSGNWEPIGQGATFGGTFDGNGNTIIYHITNSTVEANGLFSEIAATGTVKNLSVSGSIFSSGNFNGGIAGKNGGLIINCLSTVDITTSKTHSGGIAGSNWLEASKTRYCVSTGTLTWTGASNAYAYIGGITGENRWGAIDHCAMLGDVLAQNTTESWAYAGILIGREMGSTTDCYYLNTAETAGAVNSDSVTAKTADELKEIGQAAYDAGYTVYGLALGAVASNPDQEAADAVIALINAIGTVEYTDACKAKIDTARDAYDALTTEQKELVTNYSTLTKAEEDYEALIPVTYTITWKNGDTVLETDENVAEGATPTYDGTTPTKAEDENYTYTFSGWTDGTNTYGASDTLPAVTGDITYTATFDSTKRSYTITWKNDDGSVIDTTTVEYGETPTHADPEKAEDEIYTYTFSGWSPEVTAVTGDADYTATFTPIAKPHEHDGVSFVPWTSTNSLPTEAGNYYLGYDVTLPSTWTVPAGETNLCLNGHGIKRTGNGNVITVSSDASLTLYDCDRTTTHYYTIASPTGNGAGLATVGESGTAFTGGYITGGNNSNGGGVVVQGTFTMNAGTIIGNNASNTGAGVFVAAGGSFNMNDGALVGNTAKYGGGVGSAAGGSKPTSLVISGGTVAYNRTTGTGGGVHTNANGQTPGVNGTDLTIAGSVKIINNHTNGEWNNANAGGGVVIDGSGIRFNLSGNPVIKDNTAGSAGSPNNLYFYNRGNPKVNISGTLTNDNRIGVTMRSPGVFTTGYNTYHPDDDPTDYFTSDDSSCFVTLDANKEVMLGEYFTVTWKDANGNVVETDENVPNGTTPEFNGTVTPKPEDDEATYSIEWSPKITPVTGNVTYTAVNRPTTKRLYKIDVIDTAYNDTRTLIGKTSLWYDTTGLILFRLQDYGYTTVNRITVSNAGDNILAISGSDITIKKAGTESINVFITNTGYVPFTITVTPYYTVTWKNYDGTVLKADEVLQGTTPAYSGTTPTKSSDEENNYVFDGWTPEVTAVTGDVTYTATFTAENKAVKKVTALINALPAAAEITAADKAQIESARAAYDALTDGQKALVTNETLDKLTAAETAIADLEAAQAVTDLINALPSNPTLDDKAAVEAARQAYDALTDGQKALVTNETLEKLAVAETAIADLEAAKPVEDMINALPTDVTVDDKAQIEAARAAYDALTDDQKALITTETLDKLTVAETALAEAESRLNGPQDDGYFYLDDVKQLKYQLIKWNGDYYFINDYDKYAKNAKLYLTNTYLAGSGLAAGLYEFGADGKMQLKNGPQPDGYFYENGIRSNKLYRFVEFEGDWYFIYDAYKYAKNARLYLSGAFLEGTDFAPGYFDFDADGKYYIPEELPEGANADGYFYINGVKQTRYQLIKYGNDYYFINDGDKYAKNTKLYLSSSFVSGTDLPAGLYEFGADGKMIISTVKNGPQDDGYFYINGARQNAYQLVNYEGDYYFINDGHKIAKNARLYLGSTFLKGTDFAPGYYVFGADGKMVIAA